MTASTSDVILALDEVAVGFAGRGLPWARRPPLRALDGVSLDVRVGEAVGVIGESGSGKSTLARVAAGLERPTAGAVRVLGHDLTGASARQWRAARRAVQIVFQDPVGSLDPLMRVDETIVEPLQALCPEVDRPTRQARARELMADMRLAPVLLSRRPHELSGGQCQRVSIARALSVKPQLIILDEALSALDISVQAQLVELLERLRAQWGIAMLFISHSLGLVHRLCDRVVVLHHGQVIESGPAHQICTAPHHPYTQALVAASPSLAPLQSPQGS